MTDHMRAQGMRLWHWSNDLAPSFHWKIGTERDEDMESSGRQNGRVISGQHSQQEAYTLPHIRRISTSSSRRDDDVELDILPNSTPQR